MDQEPERKTPAPEVNMNDVDLKVSNPKRVSFSRENEQVEMGDSQKSSELSFEVMCICFFFILHLKYRIPKLNTLGEDFS